MIQYDPTGDDPIIAIEAKRLHNLLIEYSSRFGMNDHTFDNVTRLLKEHQDSCNQRGIAFPDLVPLLIPRVQALEVVRADIEREGLQVTILNLTVKYPAIRPDDIAQAVFKSFPQFRRTNFMIHHSERRRA